jgi:hypothetical protein
LTLSVTILPIRGRGHICLTIRQKHIDINLQKMEKRERGLIDDIRTYCKEKNVNDLPHVMNTTDTPHATNISVRIAPVQFITVIQV